MIIVNADDLGRNQAATDAIVECHGDKRITSTSAMVFMADSERAATLAREHEIDVGLHINFSEAFTHSACPPNLRKAQGRIGRFLKLGRYALLIYHPFLRGAFAEVVRAQFLEFERLYGQPPIRVDGHQHLHLCTNVLFSRFIPEGLLVRRSFAFSATEKSAFNRAYRAWVDRKLMRRYQCVDLFFNLVAWNQEALGRQIVLGQNKVVELMTHPERPEERDFLLSDEYLKAFRGVAVGTFRELKTGANPTVGKN